jgi:hypothetical protein
MRNPSTVSRAALVPALAALVLAGAVLAGCPAEPPPRRREPPPEFRQRPVRFAPGEQPPAPEPEPTDPAEPASAPASVPAAAPRPSAEPGLDPDQYSNPIAGFRIRKPKGWHFLTPEQLRDAQEELMPDNEMLRGLLKAAAQPPMVAFAKHKEPHAAMNPNVRVTYRPDPFPEKPLVKALDESLAIAKGFVKDFKVIGKPTATTIAGHEAAQARVQQAIKAPSFTGVVQARVVMVRKGRGFYSIGMTGLPTGADRCEAEFAAALASIRME